MKKLALSGVKSSLGCNQKQRKERFWIFVFLLPTIIWLLIYNLMPVCISVVTAFCKWDGFSTPEFNGLDNFKFLFFKDVNFFPSLINTLKWLVIQLVVQTLLGLLAGFVMSRESKGWKIFRNLLMVPHIVPTAALATMFFFIYNPDMGLLNGILKVFGLESLATNWLGYESTAFLAVTGSWIFYCGFVGILFYSGIIAVPVSQRESALLDGCTRLQTDIYIVLPQLKGTIASSMIMSATTGIGMFDFIYMLTKGGPGNSTMNLPLMIYSAATSGSYGRAMALCLIQTVIGVVTIAIINKLLVKDGEI